MLTWNRTIALLNRVAVIPMFAQSPPASPDRPWHSPDERQIVSEGSRFRQSAFRIESDKTYSLAELVDLAEAHNPETRVTWENARAQAAALGIARSELYPTLSTCMLRERGETGSRGPRSIIHRLTARNRQLDDVSGRRDNNGI
jgi:outer membrane protein TolC